MEALWLKSQGLAHNQITKLTAINENTLARHLYMYKEGGIEKLKQINLHRTQSDLANHKETIEDYFRNTESGLMYLEH